MLVSVNKPLLLTMVVSFGSHIARSLSSSGTSSRAAFWNFCFSLSGIQYLNRRTALQYLRKDRLYMNSASRNSIVRPSVFSEIRTNEKSNRNGLTRQSLNGTGKRTGTNLMPKYGYKYSSSCSGKPQCNIMEANFVPVPSPLKICLNRS